MRIFRFRSREMRLEVMFATAPEVNVTRALAMSSVGVSTGTPTAEMSRAPAPTSVSSRSMSWIMRSSTTATSDPRGLNGASLSLSMNRGCLTCGSAARTARLKRSMWPICTITPFFPASARRASASSRVAVMGFSMNTCLPRSIAALATVKCADVGTTMMNALHRLCDVEVGAEEKSIRSLEFSYRCFIHPAPLQADGIQAVESDRISDCFEKWRDVFGDTRTAADETVSTDAHELVHGGQPGEDCLVVDDHVSGELHDIRQDHVVADVAIVAQMHIRH